MLTSEPETGWVCEKCKSVNRASAGRCYKCRSVRPAPIASAAGPSPVAPPAEPEAPGPPTATATPPDSHRAHRQRISAPAAAASTVALAEKAAEAAQTRRGRARRSVPAPQPPVSRRVPVMAAFLTAEGGAGGDRPGRSRPGDLPEGGSGSRPGRKAHQPIRRSAATPGSAVAVAVVATPADLDGSARRRSRPAAVADLPSKSPQPRDEPQPPTRPTRGGPAAAGSHPGSSETPTSGANVMSPDRAPKRGGASSAGAQPTVERPAATSEHPEPASYDRGARARHPRPGAVQPTPATSARERRPPAGDAVAPRSRAKAAGSSRAAAGPDTLAGRARATPSDVCPLLGLKDDPMTHFELPHAAHRCHATASAEPIAADHQAAYCYGEYSTCARYRAHEDVSRGK